MISAKNLSLIALQSSLFEFPFRETPSLLLDSTIPPSSSISKDLS